MGVHVYETNGDDDNMDDMPHQQIVIVGAAFPGSVEINVTGNGADGGGCR